MIKVSVIIPVYNSEKYLDKCIKSLVNQTLEEIELIFVNDGSEDSSLKILNDYQKLYPEKIIVLDNKVNKGIGITRNKGIKVAKGEYIGFVDSDDFVDKTMYEELYTYAKDNRLDIVNSYYKKVFPNKTIEFGRMPHDITNVRKRPNLINEIEYGPTTKIYKTSLILENKIKFEEKLKYEDMPFVLKAYYHSERIGYVDKAFYNYQINDNSETTTMDQKVFDMFDILNIINKVYSDDIYKEAIEYLNIRQITRYMLQQKHQINKKYKNNFISKGYKTLNVEFLNWKQNKYYKEENKLKRIIKNNKFLLKTYCFIGRYL